MASVTVKIPKYRVARSGRVVRTGTTRKTVHVRIRKKIGLQPTTETLHGERGKFSCTGLPSFRKQNDNRQSLHIPVFSSARHVEVCSAPRILTPQIEQWGWSAV